MKMAELDEAECASAALKSDVAALDLGSIKVHMLLRNFVCLRAYVSTVCVCALCVT